MLACVGAAETADSCEADLGHAVIPKGTAARSSGCLRVISTVLLMIWSALGTFTARPHSSNYETTHVSGVWGLQAVRMA